MKGKLLPVRSLAKRSWKRWCAVGAAIPAILVAGCSSPTLLADIAYDERYGSATRLDLFLPDGGGPAPAVVILHGGLFRSGDKSDERAAGARLAGAGYVTAILNYRLAPGAPFPAAVRDASCALAFLRAGARSYGIDPERIAVVGSSAGGYLAAMLGVAEGAPDLASDCAAGLAGPPQAVVGNEGLYDLSGVSSKGEVQAFLGTTLEKDKGLYELASPASRVGPGAPPFLLITGDFDFVVPPAQATSMREALKTQGGDVRVLELTDPGHYLAAGADNGGLYAGGVAARPETWIALLDFLEETLGRP